MDGHFDEGKKKKQKQRKVYVEIRKTTLAVAQSI